MGFDEADRASLEGLLESGRQNGVEGLELIDGDEARVLEPALSGEVTCALRVRTGAICDPYEVAFLGPRERRAQWRRSPLRRARLLDVPARRQRCL